MKRPYFLHPAMTHQIREYMEEHEEFTLEELSDYLIATYKEYHSKQRMKKTFMKSVDRAYKWELQCEQERAQEEATKEKKVLLEIESDCSMVSSDEEQKADVKNDLEVEKVLPSKKRKKSDKSPAKTPDKILNQMKRKKSNIVDNEEIEMVNTIKKPKFEVISPTGKLEDMKGIESLYQVAYLLWVCLYNGGVEVAAPKSSLLIGPQGSGKTMFALSLAASGGARVVRVSVSDLLGIMTTNSGNSMSKTLLNDVAASMALNITKDVKKKDGAKSLPNGTNPTVIVSALEEKPPGCVILLEGIDMLTPNRDAFIKGPERKVADLIIATIEALETKESSSRILLLAESRNPSGIDAALRSRLKTEVVLPPLDRKARLELITTFCPGLSEDMDLKEVVLRTSSFVAADLKDLVQKARQAAWARLTKDVLGANVMSTPSQFFERYEAFSEGRLILPSVQDFMSAIPTIVPTLKREGFPSVPDTTWDDVGGLEHIKDELYDKILGPMQHGALHDRFGAKKPTGIMLWGPPGCGKTLLAKAVANHAGVNLYAVMGPELLNMYQGESERAIREVFRRASAVAPCVIFFDEFDCICPRRVASADTGSKTTIVNTLLVELNGFQTRRDVYVMAATNRPDMVDPAVLRPERFDTALFVGLPDSAARVAVFNACTKNGTEPRLAPDVNLNDVSKWCAGFSGADCTHVIFCASKAAIAELLANGQSSIETVGVLYKRHFQQALKKVKPSIGAEEKKKYIQMKHLFDYSRSNVEDGEGTKEIKK